jgi:hypothetical protein
LADCGRARHEVLVLFREAVRVVAMRRKEPEQSPSRSKDSDETYAAGADPRKDEPMRVFVVHDANGEIKSLGVPAPGASGIGVKPGPGEHVSIVEIEVVDHPGHLTKYALGHRVDTSGQRPTIVRK